MNNSHPQLDPEAILPELGQKLGLSASERAGLRSLILQQIAGLPQATKPTAASWRMGWISTALASILILTTGGLAFANRAAPGDILYPVDQWAETITIRLVRDELARAKLYSSFAEERLGELEVVARQDQLRQEAADRLARSVSRLDGVQGYLETKKAALPEGLEKDQVRGVLRYLQVLEKNRQTRLEAIEQGFASPEQRQTWRDRVEVDDEQSRQLRDQIRAEFEARQPEVKTSDTEEDQLRITEDLIQVEIQSRPRHPGRRVD